MTEPNLEQAKALLEEIRNQFDAIRDLDESMSAAELKSIKSAFVSILMELPADAGGKDEGQQWAKLEAPERQRRLDELSALNNRMNEYMGFVRANNLIPQRASFGARLAVVIYAVAMSLALLTLVLVFWNSGSSTDAIKSIAKVTRLEKEVERAGKKTNEAKEQLTSDKEKLEEAEQAVLAAVNKAPAPSPGEIEDPDRAAEPATPPALPAPPVTNGDEPKTSPSNGDDDASPTDLSLTLTALPAEPSVGEQGQAALPAPVDESAEPTAGSSSDAAVVTPAPEAPVTTPQDNPSGPSQADAEAAKRARDVAAAHAIRATEQARRALADRAAAEQATKVAAQHAASARAERTAAEQATEVASKHAAVAQAAAKEAAQAEQTALKSFAGSVEAPRRAAESIRDAAAQRMQAAQQAADAAMVAEEVLVEELADAREELSQAEVLSHSRGVFTMCLLFGALGATLRMIGSLGAYIAARKLYRSWLIYYYYMPAEGALLGIAIYLVLGAGLFTPSIEGTDASQFGNPLYIFALAMLAGTFAKNALQKLRDIADATFGKPSRRDALPE